MHLCMNSRTLFYPPILVLGCHLSALCLFILTTSCRCGKTEKHDPMMSEQTRSLPASGSSYSCSRLPCATSAINQKPSKGQCFPALSQGGSISQPSISRGRLRKSKRFRDHVVSRRGQVREEHWKFHQRKNIANKPTRTTDYIKHKEAQ